MQIKTKSFSVGEMYKFSWAEWKKNWLKWIGIMLLVVIIPTIPQTLLMNISEESIVSRILLSLIYIALSVLVNMGAFTIALKAARQESFEFSDFFSKFHLFSPYFIAELLYVLGITIGLFLFIIPGVIFSLKFNLWPFLVLDRSNKALKALNASDEVTQGAKWDLLLFWIFAVLINLVGLVFFFIGILIAWPLTLIAWAKIYLTLTEETPTQSIEGTL